MLCDGGHQQRVGVVERLPTALGQRCEDDTTVLEDAFVTDTVGNTRRTMDPSRSRLRRLLESVACEMPSALQRSGHAPPRYPRRFREAARVTPLRVRHRFRWRVQPSEAAPVLQLLTCHRHNTDATSDAGLH